MTIEIIKDLIWNIGGFLFTILLILVVLAFMSQYIVNRLSWWSNKEYRGNLLYWIRNKKRLNEIIEKEKKVKR